MTPTPPTQNLSSTDEISLLELWQILVRRKQWILFTLAVCVVAALAFIFIKAPVYQASVKLRIGQVAGTGLFEPAEELSARLLAHYGEDVADGVKRERPFLARAAAQKNVAATVELVAEADRPEDAVALLERIFEGVRNRTSRATRRTSSSSPSACRTSTSSARPSSSSTRTPPRCWTGSRSAIRSRPRWSCWSAAACRRH
jgi:hypothetical protein